MRRFLLICLSILVGFSASAQTMAEDIKTWVEDWKYTFSPEGRKTWRPEFTARVYMELNSKGPAITGGVRINNKRTLGLMVWQDEIYIDAAPGHFWNVSAGLYTRRYFHLGKKDIVALYSDLAIGARYVYKVRGNIESMEQRPGDIWFAAVWDPGIRFRFWRNVHMFLGPQFSTNVFGLHLGVGF